MHKAWLQAFTASVCVVGLSATAVFADPASMAMSRRSSDPATSGSLWPWSSSTASTAAPAAPVPAVQPTTAWPSAAISPWKHPIAYFEASVSEMPTGWKSKSAAHPVVPSTQQKYDPLSLSVPTGPPTPEFFIFAAQMCERQGDIPQARQNLQRALSMWPGNGDVLRAAARMEDRQGNLPLAESLYQQAVAANPQNGAALNDLGLCLAREGKLEPSLQVIEQAVQQQPDKALYRNNAATVLVEMRQDQRALAHLAAVHNPADAEYNLGHLLVERGRPADAVAHFQAALQQNPNMQSARDAIAKLGPQVNAAPQMAALPAAAPQSALQVGPIIAPQQQAGPAGPQFAYPATARTPLSAPSNAVPQLYQPSMPFMPGGMQR